jgi:hypothetical protein
LSISVTPKLSGKPKPPSSVLAPGRYTVPPSLTETSSIDSPGRIGMSRYAPLKSPAKSNVMCSRTRSEPSGRI